MSERRDANENNQSERVGGQTRRRRSKLRDQKGQTREQSDEQEATKTPPSLNN